jgi:autotransporter-associated beta strand protein
VNFNHTGDTTFAPAMIGTLAVTKAGPGTTTLSGNNTFTGTTTVSAGLVQIDANSRLGNSTLTLAGGGIRYGAAFNDLRAATLTGSGGTFDTTGFTISYASALSGTGAVTKTGLGSLTLAGNKSYSGGTTVTQGTLVAGAAGAFGGGVIAVGSLGTLDLGGYAVSNVIANSGGSVINAGGYAGTQTVTGVVSMTGTVGGVVNVAAGGVLKGSQTVFTGAATVATGGTHSPGNSPGMQTFAAGITYDAGSILTWELIANSGTGAGTNYDFLSVTGGSLAIASGAIMNLDFSGSGSTVDWNNPFWALGHSWKVFDAALAASSSGAFTLGTVSSDSFGQSLTSVRPLASFEVTRSGSDAVVVYVVPEPCTSALALAGLACGVLLARRRLLRDHFDGHAVPRHVGQAFVEGERGASRASARARHAAS